MPDLQTNSTSTHQFKQGMLPRHIVMFSIGGTIGAGLFIGIAEPLNNVGPLGTMLAYLAAGILMLGTMMCLTELSTAFPHSGSFQHYSLLFFKNPIWSFLIGWMYWLSWVFAIAAGLIAAAIISNELMPLIPVWEFCLGFLIALTAVNALSAKAFGECEYWLAGIKVFAIIFFICCGTYLIVHQSCTTTWVPSLKTENGYFPNGFLSIVYTMAVVVYSFQGAELVGNVASETPHPEQVLPTIIKGIGVRIILFYVVAVGILAIINPNGYQITDSGPFVEVFRRVGIPWTDTFMKLVILSAALSAANSGIYACSRMLWSMAEENMAPRFFSKLSKRKVPLRSILLCSCLAMVCVLTKNISAQRLFLFFIASTAQVGCAAWMIIALCQMAYRKGVQAGVYVEATNAYRCPLYPFTPIFVILTNVAIIVGGWFGEDGFVMLLAQLFLVIFLVIVYKLRIQRRIDSVEVCKN